MTDKDPWQLKLPWLFALLAATMAMLVFGVYGPDAGIAAIAGIGLSLAAISTKGKLVIPSILKSMGLLVVRITFFLLLISLVIDGLLANWQLSFWGIFLAVDNGVLFQGVHALSVLGVCVAAFYLIWVKRSIPAGVLLAFSTATIHEYVWAGFEYVTLRQNQVVSLGYGVALLLFLAGGLYVSNRGEKKILGLILVACLSYWLILYGFNVTDWGQIQQPDLFAINVETVIGWLVPTTLWVFARKSK